MKFFSKYPWSVSLLIIPTLVWCGNGCDPNTTQPPTSQIIDTNIQTRFRVTAQYVQLPPMIPNVVVYDIKDTQGTNCFIGIKVDGGDLRILPVASPSTNRLEN
jgi:hypothetical protein